MTILPIMMHWSTAPDLLAIMKAGDILTHPFNRPEAHTRELRQQFVGVATVKGGVFVKGGIAA